jgi:hemoglobin
MDTKSLFERLGGSPGIKAIVDDLVAAHMENAVIGSRFRPYLETPDKVSSIKEHVCRFFEMGSGGPQNYQGKGMRGAHQGMNINEAELVAALDDTMMVLKKHGVDEQSQKDVLAIMWSLKGEVLHV